MVIFTGIRPLSSPPHTPEPNLSSHCRNTRSKLEARPLLIVKYGGSSLSTPRRITDASERMADEYSRGTRLIVVVSAAGRTTDGLIRLTGGAINDTDRDDIVAMGERTSARIFAASLKARGVQTRYFDPVDRDWPIITDEDFSNANPLLGPSINRIRKHVRPLLDEGIVPVIGGFIGRTIHGQVSTLGRGGSDTTAFLLAKALGADEVILVTNVPGIMTADPRLVPGAQILGKVELNMLMGLADTGRKFIHRKALRYKDTNVNVRIMSYETPDLRSSGTLITGEGESEVTVRLHNPHPVASATLIGTNLARWPDLSSKITKTLGRSLVAESKDENSIIVYLKQGPGFKHILNRLHKLLRQRSLGTAVMATRTDMALISLHGLGLEETPGLIARVTSALRSDGVNIFGLVTISSSVLVFVDWHTRKKAKSIVKRSIMEKI